MAIRVNSKAYLQSEPLLALVVHHDWIRQHLQQPHVQLVMVIPQCLVFFVETIGGAVEHIMDLFGFLQILEELGRFPITANLADAELDRRRRIIIGFEPALTLGNFVRRSALRIVRGVTIRDYTDEQRSCEFACLDFVIHERFQYATTKRGAQLGTASECRILQRIGKILLGRNNLCLPRIVDEVYADVMMIIRYNLGGDLSHAADKISLYLEAIFETHRCAVVAIEDGLIESQLYQALNILWVA